MSEPIEVILHEIRLRNLVFGSLRLLRLALPAGWELEKGLAPPEVSATHERGGQRWAVTARAWYVVYHPAHRWAAELTIRIAPSPPKRSPNGAQPFQVNGHPATVRVHQKRRGLPLRRHTVTFLTIAWTCPHTDRYIELEYSGWCPEEGFTALRQATTQVACH
ncbi:MAG TPA: hypothetical protein G4O04_08020 [Anaerolineae bacterium]|nr:hypothetical protein [Anaerolineae bacterium]